MEDLRAGPLVRAVSPDGITIWTEWKQPCEVTLSAAPADVAGDAQPHVVVARTVTIGSRYYALCVLTALRPATWYTYHLGCADKPGEPATWLETTLLQCFRTLDLPDAGQPLRLAYGSCRRLTAPGPDALSAFGGWLRDRYAERETLWPRVLLLIGDQIYADDPAQRSQARSFAEFALLYVKAWAGDEGVRQVLAALASLMIFDDHEITNNWNITPLWQAQRLRQGGAQMLIDGLVAYWVYQGWGNFGLQDAADHDLLAIMRQAEESGLDALAALQERIRQAIYRVKTLKWDYTLPTMPPIFVFDARADRSVAPDQQSAADIAPRIIGKEQMARLYAWAGAYEESTLVLVSSVPALLPPAIGLAEYMLGLRPLRPMAFAPLRRLVRFVSSRQHGVSARMGFEHWPVFYATWRELVAFCAQRKRDLFILSGDVHFSYAMAAHVPGSPPSKRAVLYQLVTSPFRNELGPPERRLILAQSGLKQFIYGGLHMRTLALAREKETEPAPFGLLLQNVIALVTYLPQAEEKGVYEVEHVYMGVVERKLVKVGATNFPAPRSARHQEST